MAYTAYVTAEEYVELGYDSMTSEAVINKYLKEASRNIDKLTFNRIVALEFENLTEFQQEIIKEVCCEQADFLYDNADALSSILESYAINGVSMQFGTGFNVVVESGIPMHKSTYALLEQTGLCWRGTARFHELIQGR